VNSSESLVEMIFTKCGLVYGRDFLSRWEGLNLAEVKADWQRELGRLLNYPEAILYALEHLPNKAPHVLEFRALCISSKPSEREQLAQLPPLTPEQAKAGAEVKRLAVAKLKLMGSNREAA
jgi:uncharacterized protein (DUF2384 family)